MPVGKVVKERLTRVSNIPVDISFNIIVGSNDPPNSEEILEIYPTFPYSNYLMLTGIILTIPQTSTDNMFTTLLTVVDRDGIEKYLVSKKWNSNSSSATTVAILKQDDPTVTATEKYLTFTDIIARCLRLKVRVNQLPDTDYTFNLKIRGYDVREE